MIFSHSFKIFNYCVDFYLLLFTLSSFHFSLSVFPHFTHFYFTLLTSLFYTFCMLKRLYIFMLLCFSYSRGLANTPYPLTLKSYLLSTLSYIIISLFLFNHAFLKDTVWSQQSIFCIMAPWWMPLHIVTILLPAEDWGTFSKGRPWYFHCSLNFCSACLRVSFYFWPSGLVPSGISFRVNPKWMGMIHNLI